MLSDTKHDRYLENILKMHITNVLTNVESDTELIEILL